MNQPLFMDVCQASKNLQQNFHHLLYVYRRSLPRISFRGEVLCEFLRAAHLNKKGPTMLFAFSLAPDDVISDANEVSESGLDPQLATEVQHIQDPQRGFSIQAL